MSKSKHTPGPWSSVHILGAGWQINANPGEFDFGVYKWDGVRPLMIYTLRKPSPIVAIADERWTQFPCQEWDTMQEANAHLIAAAPDLAEACAALVAAYDAARDSGSVEWEDLDEAHRLATEALKKAGLRP